jgi:hypothetical protein
VIFVALLPLLLLQPSFAQFTEDSLTVEISKDGHARVIGEITPSTTVSRITVGAIASDISDILAVDENDVLLGFSYSGDAITIDTLGSAHVTLTYTAKIVTKATSDIWELAYNSTSMQSTIILPSMSDIIYVNDIPIDIVDNIVTMPAGETEVRYKIKSVGTKDFLVAWDEKDYFVQIVTASDVQSFSFDQESKSVALILDTTTPTLVIIPKSLLGGPYAVTTSAGDPVDFRQYYQNSTHSWIRVEPNDGGAIKIVGTTVVPEFLPLAAGMAVAVAMLLLVRSWLAYR